MKQRIIGFDLARAYAIFGMFIVNFNFVFGSLSHTGLEAKFMLLFNGNSSTLFVILAGMGISLMTNRETYSRPEKIKLRSTISKRALFLFITGLLLYVWWPADILHFYGGYMHIAVLLVFVNKRYYLIAAFVAVIVFHVLLAIIPYETGWNFETLAYNDFWTIKGFLRNTFYYGWNSIFPWIGYFLLGMFLGRLNWTAFNMQRKMFYTGLVLFLAIAVLQFFSQHIAMPEELKFFINADYIPPLLPFIISTAGFGLMAIAAFLFLGGKISHMQIAKDFAAMGQMTLTHYVSHLTIGMLLFGMLTNKSYTGHVTGQEPVSPVYILLFSVEYFMASFYFSKIWSRYYQHGPLETIMRKLTS